MAEKTELEKEFDNLVATVGAQIASELDAAKAALRRARELADANGLPFMAGVSEIAQPYVPPSFRSRFSDLVSADAERDDFNGLSAYDIRDGGYGWAHSQVCW